MNRPPSKSPRTKWLDLAAIGLLSIVIIALGYFAFRETVGLFADSDKAGHAELTPPAMIGPADPAAPRARKADAITQMPQLVVLPGMALATNPSKPRDGGAASANQSLVSISSAGQSISIASINKGIVAPPLELQRQHDENSAGASEHTNVTIETGFECSPTMSVRQISPTHFALEVPTPYWFIFRVHGAAGHTVRFDIIYAGTGLRKWATLNPVYAYVTDLDDPATFATEGANPESATSSRAWNGPPLPSTNGQKWHFIANAWQPGPNVFNFVQSFDANDVTVAMRVPYTAEFNAAALSSLAKTGGAELVKVGSSTGNWPLLMLRIGIEDARDLEKPCVLIYAGEHADETDGMFAALGAARFLLGTTDEARSLREAFTFLIVPMVDPDANAVGSHMGIIDTFLTADETPEAATYANWFGKWISSGKRLDLVFDLHSVQSAESDHVACALAEGIGERGSISERLHGEVASLASETGFRATSRIWKRGWSPDRLGGWLSRRYGAIGMAYELNSQCAQRHLGLSEIMDIGALFVRSSARFLDSSDGRTALASVNKSRAAHASAEKKYGTAIAADDVIAYEAGISKAAVADGRPASKEEWVP